MEVCFLCEEGVDNGESESVFVGVLVELGDCVINGGVRGGVASVYGFAFVVIGLGEEDAEDYCAAPVEDWG